MTKCKNCKHLGYISDGDQVGKRVWCEKMADSPDLEIERECDYYVPMTNADRIRNMTDEELALALKKALFCGGLIAMNQSSAECRGCKEGYCCNIDDWLKAESEE